MKNPESASEGKVAKYLEKAGWEFNSQFRVNPGQINVISDEAISENISSQVIDFVLIHETCPIAVLEVKRELSNNFHKQINPSCKRLGLRWILGTDGDNWISHDSHTGENKKWGNCPGFKELLNESEKHWSKWRNTFLHKPTYEHKTLDSKKLKTYQIGCVSEILWSLEHSNRILVDIGVGLGGMYIASHFMRKLMFGGELTKKILWVSSLQDNIMLDVRQMGKMLSDATSEKGDSIFEFYPCNPSIKTANKDAEEFINLHSPDNYEFIIFVSLV